MRARAGVALAWAALVGAASLPPSAAALELAVSGAEIVSQLTHLATFSDDPNPAVTRLLFTGGARG